MITFLKMSKGTEQNNKFRRQEYVILRTLLYYITDTTVKTYDEVSSLSDDLSYTSHGESIIVINPHLPFVTRSL